MDVDNNRRRTALQETYVFDGGAERITKKSFRLRTDEVECLVDLITDSRFFLLAERYSYDVSDNPALVLRATMNRTSHEVMVYAPHHLHGSNEVRSLMRAWNGVLKKVPSPNWEQGPE